jgi:hypothetical protein
MSQLKQMLTEQEPGWGHAYWTYQKESPQQGLANYCGRHMAAQSSNVIVLTLRKSHADVTENCWIRRCSVLFLIYHVGIWFSQA